MVAEAGRRPFHQVADDRNSAEQRVAGEAEQSPADLLAKIARRSVAHAAEQHQHRNAEIFEQADAAQVLEEYEITPESLVRLMTNLLADDQRRQRMSEAAAALLPEHAAERIADIMELSKRC